MEEVSITTGLWLKWNFLVQGVDGWMSGQSGSHHLASGLRSTSVLDRGTITCLLQYRIE